MIRTQNEAKAEKLRNEPIEKVWITTTPSRVIKLQFLKDQIDKSRKRATDLGLEVPPYDYNLRIVPSDEPKPLARASLDKSQFSHVPSFEFDSN